MIGEISMFSIILFYIYVTTGFAITDVVDQSDGDTVYLHSDRGFYVSEGPVALDEAATICNLATPEIHFKTSGNTASLDDANLNITDGESVWSGYVQTYAAFLYEGCCEEKFANSSAIYTNMYMDPGECYSKCETDVIGMQTTTCHCNPRPREAKTHSNGCINVCSNPNGTVCGGNKAVSLYRKVQYPGSDGRAETENCRALFWKYNGQQSYTWRNCLSKYSYLCTVDVTSSIKFECQRSWLGTKWRTTTEMCLVYNKKPAVELSSGYPDSNCPRGKLIWIGHIRSLVIGKDADSNYQIPGWRRGIITKKGEEYVLQFHTNSTELNSLCEYAPSSSTISATSSDLTSAPSSVTSSAASLDLTSASSLGTSSALSSDLTLASFSDSPSAVMAESAMQNTHLLISANSTSCGIL